MKILYLIPYSPVLPTFGGAIRIYHILKSLVRNHEVTVAGFGNHTDRRRLLNKFPDLQERVHLIEQPQGRLYNLKTFLNSLATGSSHWFSKDRSQEMQKLLDHIVSEEDFDVIHSEFPAMASYELDTDALRILDAHNVEYDNFLRMSRGEVGRLRRLYYWLESKKFYREEMKTAARQDAILVTSRRDAVLFDADIPQVPKFLIPNGVDIEYFQPGGDPPEPYSMTFVGRMKYLPNDDAMNFFLDDIFPRITKRIPEAKIYIVGGEPDASLQERQNDRIVVTGFVDDVRPYIDRASVYVVPLRMGGGTRLKILEAMAMRKPVVTTTIGGEGLGLEDRITARIADRPEAFAGAVVELMQKRKLAQKITREAYNLVTRKFSWNVVGSQLQEAYARTIDNQSTFNHRKPELELDLEKLNKEML